MRGNHHKLSKPKETSAPEPIRGKALTPLLLQYIDGEQWLNTARFSWQFRDGTIVTVQDGFIHDFNSIPWIARRVLPKVKHGEAGNIHDWLYRFCGAITVEIDGEQTQVQWSREECDLRYREILEDTGATPFIVKSMFKAVRVGGWKSWREHAQRIAKEAK
ncbi:MAG: DUF1353 domain-containing protein [Limisphaerales bacterium]